MSSGAASDTATDNNTGTTLVLSQLGPQYPDQFILNITSDVMGLEGKGQKRSVIFEVSDKINLADRSSE